jgi:two-component system, cell cycle sensor histidine kinase and response regulator CckA
MTAERILIIEDEKSITAEIQNIVEILGYTVLASSVEEALEKASGWRPELVLMEVKLIKEIEGLEVARQINRCFHIPIVYLVGHADDDCLGQAIETGPLGYLFEPFKNVEVRTIIETVLRRHKLERELRKCEPAIFDAFRDISDSVIASDTEETVRFMNRAAESLTGWKQGDVLNKKMGDIFRIRDGEGGDLVENPIKKVLRAGIAVKVDHFMLMAKDGAEKTIDGSIAPIRDNDGDITGTILLFHESMDQRQAEKKLRLFEEAVETMQLGLTITGEKGKILYTNPAEAAMHGYKVEELIGQNVRILAPREIWKPMTIEQLKTMNRWKRESTNIRKDGSLFPVQLMSVVGTDIAGNAIGVITTCEDITERKRAENALQESEEYLKNILDSINAGIILTDPETHEIIEGNSFSIEMMGLSKDQVLGQSWNRFRCLSENGNSPAKGRRPASVSSEEILVRASGEQIPILKSVVPVLLKGHRYLITTFFDISERKRTEKEKEALEEQYRRSQKMEAIGQMAGGIAHNFNNILTVIQGYTQFSLKLLGESDPLRENIIEIQRSTERATSLIQQLLTFSRRHVFEMKIIDLKSLLKDLERMLQPTIGEDIELVTVVPEDPYSIEADPGQIQQVILNLVVNARDAMPHGGKLTIEMANVELNREYISNKIKVVPGHYVELSVSDTGIGMSPEVKERIFEPFFTTKEIGKGTGLGLSSAYGIVEQLGGNILVSSEPGQGTTFKIYLPRVDEVAESIDTTGKSTSPPPGSGTILLVEDEENLRKLARKILQKNGYWVLEAANGEEALFVAQEYGTEQINLMVTDVVMPRMNGFELAKRLAPLHPETKVLCMSGNNSFIHHNPLSLGKPFLSKPFTPDGLLNKVREVLNVDSNG